MAGTLTPFAIVVGGVLATILIFASSWSRIARRAAGFGEHFRRDLDLADVRMKAEDFGFLVLTAVAITWIGAVLLLRPTPVIGALYLLLILGGSAYIVRMYLRTLIGRRVKAFGRQLETVLRSLVSGVRVGLGLRQALVHVAERSNEPARKELLRAVGFANLGASIYDALDEMARRVPSAEVAMFARVVRVQSNSGGDLAGVLEGMADTIRDRRRLERRVSVLTMQGRASAWVIGALPLAIFSFVMVTQADLRFATLHTSFGHAVIFLGLGFDALAGIVLSQMTRFDA